MADWARDKPALKGMITEFNLLRQQPHKAAIVENCAKHNCQTKAEWMTLPLDKDGWCHSSPYFWCSEHNSWEKTGISEKYPVHFDAIQRVKIQSEKMSLFKRVRRAMGIKPRTRITEEFAQHFFN